MTRFTLAVAGAVLASSATLAQAADLSAVPSGDYAVDPTHAYINFQYNHLGLSNPTLSFDEFTIDLNLDNADPTKSTVAVSIDVASVVTGSEIWHDHLTGDNWMKASEHPTITFQSTGLEAAGEGYKLMGDVTVMGVTKPMALDVTINAAMMHPMAGKPVIGFDASGSLLRSDFGLGKFAPNVGDELAINISAELLAAQ